MRWSYYRAAARSAGVPDMWLDDAAQDIAIATWQAGEDTNTIVYRRAVDAARTYGVHSRKGVRRVNVELDYERDVAPDQFSIVTMVVSVMQSMKMLTSKQRIALTRAMMNKPMTSLDSAHASAARKNVRRLLFN